MDLSKGICKPLYELVFRLYKRGRLWRIPVVGGQQVKKDLEYLHPGENKEELWTAYYVQKLTMALLVCLLGMVLALVLFWKNREELLLQEDGTVPRGSYSDPARELELTGSLEQGEKFPFQVVVEPRQMTKEEAENLYLQFACQLEQEILGENSSLEEVTEDLELWEQYANYPFSVEWYSSQRELITPEGMTAEVEIPETVILTAHISYEEWNWDKEFLVTVVPPRLTEEEKIYRELEQLLAESQKEQRKEKEWKLPESIRGAPVQWEEKESYAPLWTMAGSIVTAILIFFLRDKDMHASLEKRRESMKRAYPDVVQKLALYLGAGLTIQSACIRITEEYEKAKRNGKREQPIYEEMLYFCREIQTGTSQGAAYEHFGKRTGLQEYIRLSTLLTQNLKKGNKALLQRLREETSRSLEERLQKGRKLSEEAVTKLLLPMVLLLLVVMIIIMFPAFSSVGI